MTRWKLNNLQYEYIKGEVIHIFELYDVRCIPVSGFEIAIKMGMRLVPYSTLNRRAFFKALETSPDGFYVEKDGEEMIFFEDIGNDYARQNMTLLHEIGHCVLDHTGHDRHEEDEAKFFAKYAIAPPVLVEKINARSPEDIYRAFDISYEAAVYAWSYYKSWKKHHKRVGCYTDYEEKLLAIYDKLA